MGEKAVALLTAAVAAVTLGGCRPEVPSSAASAASTPAARNTPRPPVDQVRDWTNPKRPKPVARERNPFEFGSDAPRGGRAPVAPDVPPASLQELPLQLPPADLRLIGIVGTDDAGQFTAIVTIGNDLVFARAGDTIASRYRVVAVGEDSLDVIDAVGNQPRHLSLRENAQEVRP